VTCISKFGLNIRKLGHLVNEGCINIMINLQAKETSMDEVCGHNFSDLLALQVSESWS
jgi:hypothetical protein